MAHQYGVVTVCSLSFLLALVMPLSIDDDAFGEGGLSPSAVLLSKGGETIIKKGGVVHDTRGIRRTDNVMA